MEGGAELLVREGLATATFPAALEAVVLCAQQKPGFLQAALNIGSRV